MHIADGIVSIPILITGSTLAAAGVAIGLAKTSHEQIPRVAVLSAAFFVASLIHVPVGPGQAHLILNGLTAIILGWAVFPALLIGLLLQAILFGYGGVTVIGVNTLNMALPGIICYYLLGGIIRKNTSRPIIFAAGFAVGALAISGSAAMIASTLYFTNQEFMPVAGAIIVAHLPIIIVEGILSGATLTFLKKVQPRIFSD